MNNYSTVFAILKIDIIKISKTINRSVQEFLVTMPTIKCCWMYYQHYFGMEIAKGKRKSKQVLEGILVKWRMWERPVTWKEECTDIEG